MARPVFAADGRFEGIPITFGGSCCIVVYRGDPWILSARHVLKARGAEPQDIKVPIEAALGRLTFFETLSVLYPEDRDKEDTAWLDLVMIRVRRDQKPFTYIDLDTELVAPLNRATFDDAIRVCGYPISLESGIDYERLHISLERFSIDGAYWGARSSRYLHAVTFSDFGKVRDLNGMSGGPAFFAPHREGRYFFAGIVVTGSVQSNRMHFVDVAAIVKTLRWHYDEDPNRPF